MARHCCSMNSSHYRFIALYEQMPKLTSEPIACPPTVPSTQVVGQAWREAKGEGEAGVSIGRGF
jgi:hypothetical protein